MKTLSTLFFLFAAILVSFGQINIGPETTTVIPSSAYWSRVIGNWPDSNSVCSLNPPVFKWVYDETIPLTASNDVRLFRFQLSTNSTPFSSYYWNIACSNNMYNFVPPITNSDGSTYTGPCFWRIIYNDTNFNPVWTGPTNYFVMTNTATIWNRAMLGDPAYLTGLASVHPHIFFKATNISSIIAWRKATPWDFHAQSYSTMTNLQVTFYQAQSWWNSNTLTNGTLSTFLSGIGGACNAGFTYYLSESNAMIDIPGACTTLDYAATMCRQQGYDFQDAYNADPVALQELGLAYDWLYPFMSTNQRTNVAGILRSFVLYGAFGGDCFYGDQHFSPTNRDYPYYPYSVPHESHFKLGSSHPRYDIPVATVACMATMGEDPVTLGFFPLFANYSIFQLDPDLGDEGRGYAESGNFALRQFGAGLAAIATFPEAHLELNPVLTNMSLFFASWEPVGFHDVFENWGDLSYGLTGQYYHYRYHDIANIRGNGGILREYNRYNNSFRYASAEEIPVFEAFSSYYFSKPTETDFPTNSYLDLQRGWGIMGSSPSSDYGAFSNALTLVVQGRPSGRNADHGSFTDGQWEFFGYGCNFTANGAAGGYAKHPMYYNGQFINGLGTHTQISPPTDPIYSKIDHWTNNARFGYVSIDTTLAMPRTNFITGGLGDMTQIFYNQASNTTPQVLLTRRHVAFPEHRFLMIYDEFKTTTNSWFQVPWHIAQATSVVNTNARSWSYVCSNNFASAGNPSDGSVTVYVTPIVNTNSIGLLNVVGTNLAKFNPFTGENYMGLDNDTGPFFSSTIWMTNTVKSTNTHFATVVYPCRSGETPPTVTPYSDNSCIVSNASLNVGISWSETNATILAAVGPTNYYIFNTFNTTTNLQGGGGGSGGGNGGNGDNPITLYGPFFKR